MSYEFYKIIHLIGLMLTFSGLAGYLSLNFSGTAPAGAARKFVFISHGVGLVLLLVAGFGMAARQGYMSAWPHWLTAKIAIWIVLGVSIAIIKRRPTQSWINYAMILFWGAVAVALAVLKPF